MSRGGVGVVVAGTEWKHTVKSVGSDVSQLLVHPTMGLNLAASSLAKSFTAARPPLCWCGFLLGLILLGITHWLRRSSLVRLRSCCERTVRRVTRGTVRERLQIWKIR